MLVAQNVDQIRTLAVNVVRALDEFQLAYLNTIGLPLDDMQTSGQARLLFQMSLPKPRRVAHKKVQELPVLTDEEAALLKSMPFGENFWIRDLPLTKKLGGRHLIGFVRKLHQLGYIEPAGKGSNKVTFWRRLH